jgi:branched-chain amino acid transport system substrate-binding protein
MEAFGQDVQDVANANTMSGYVAMAGLLTAMVGLPEDITHETVIETVKAMPESDLPGGGGMTYQCGGSVFPELPAVCTNQSLRTQLDAEGQPTTYEVVDGTDLLPDE